MALLYRRVLLSVPVVRSCSLSRNYMRAIIGVENIDIPYQTRQKQSHRHISARCFSTTKVTHCETKANSDQEEVDKFSRIAFSWWDENGDFKALHTLNSLRIPLIRDGLCRGSITNVTQPLKGLRLLDVGCGGGILSEPLSRLGGNVTGIDASPDNVKMAQWHADLDPAVSKNISYQCCLVEEIAELQPETFDGVVASEILEHVPNPKDFIDACCQLVKPGGSIFITSLNKTALSYALGIVAAEQILRLVPEGAHDWNKFVHISNLKQMLVQNGFSVRLVSGMMLNPLTLRWSWFPDTSINYAVHAIKNSIRSDPIGSSPSSSSSNSDSDADK